MCVYMPTFPSVSLSTRMDISAFSEKASNRNYKLDVGMDGVYKSETGNYSNFHDTNAVYCKSVRTAPIVHILPSTVM